MSNFKIQILGLRGGEVFFEDKYRVDTEEEIFKDTNSILANIPESRHVNLYFTVARCHEARGRLLGEQWLIPWDIDNVAPGKSEEETKKAAEEHARVACEVLGVDYSKTAVVFSGNGVQFFIKIKNPILSRKYFDTAKECYSRLAQKISEVLKSKGMIGEVDGSVFCHARLMRLPNTKNEKPGKEPRFARVLQGNLEIVDFDLVEKSGISLKKERDVSTTKCLKRYPPPDTEAVISKCLFLKFCIEKPNEVKEPQWHSSAGIFGRLADGRNLFHQISKGYTNYSEYETDNKLDHALREAGPHWCETIDARWGGCKDCEFYGTGLTSPICIRGKNYILTKDTGFRKINKDTGLRGKIDYDDLAKQFELDFNFVNFKDHAIPNVFNGKYWEPISIKQIKNWMQKKVSYSPSVVEMNEFIGRILPMNIVDQESIRETTYRKMNFQNGVLDIDTKEVSLHSSEIYFTHVLPYDYDPRAKCPKWDKFLLDVTGNDPELVRLLEQFGGYCIAGGPCKAQKAMVLYGDGGNGKSVYTNTLRSVAGMDNTSGVHMKSMGSETSRDTLTSKLFNVGDEMGSKFDEDFFNTLVTGGPITIRKLYENEKTVNNTTKLIFSTNNLPDTRTVTGGLFRRLIIVPFDVKFEGLGKDNKGLEEELREELPGICNKLIAGLKTLVSNKYFFDIPKKCDALLEAYRNDSNPVSEFAEDYLEVTTNAEDYVSFSDVYGTYKMIYGIKALNKKRFSTSLQKLYRNKDVEVGKVKYISGKTTRIITNCKLINQKSDFE